MKTKDTINDFFIFLFKTDPVIVDRILNELQTENKCGKAPELAKKILKELRKKEIIKQLKDVDSSYLFSVLLSIDNKRILEMITSLINELASVHSCKIKTQKGGKKSKKRSVKKSKRRSVKKSKRRSCHKDKVAQVMSEFKHGKLKSSSGAKVTNRSQAVAIALSVANKKCF